MPFSNLRKIVKMPAAMPAYHRAYSKIAYLGTGSIAFMVKRGLSAPVNAEAQRKRNPIRSLMPQGREDPFPGTHP
jgi:hypothetical protein